jgi:uncharacterized protein YlxW (UPF0749 family)
MSIQEQIEKMKTDVIAQAIADKVAEQLKSQWSTVVNELVSHRKSNEKLVEAISNFNAKVDSFKNYVDTSRAEAKLNVENQQKALRLMKEALEELGIEG